MANRKRSKTDNEIVTMNTPVAEVEAASDISTTPVIKEQEVKPVTVTERKKVRTQKTEEKKPKYPVGSIVYVSKDAEADLNGFKLFAPYKKYTYTVEAYDATRDVYSLRKLNLSLRLKETDIVSPREKSDSSLIRRQF